MTNPCSVPSDPAFGARMARQELLLARSSSADRSRGGAGAGAGGGMFEFSSDDDVENEIDAVSPANAARIIGTRLGRQRGEFFCVITYHLSIIVEDLRYELANFCFLLSLLFMCSVTA